MSEESQKRWITPTYQANLNAAIRDTMICLNHGDLWGAWECTQTLFICLTPPVVEDECKKDFDEIETTLKRIVGTNSVNLVLGQIDKRERIMRVLANRNRQFLGKLKRSLFKHGYLEKMPTQPRAKGPGRLRIEE